MTREDYDFVARFVHQRSGLCLGPDQAYLVESRLDELSRRLSLAPEALLSRARLRDREAEQHLVQAMTVNETSFFRDRAVWDRLRRSILPGLLAGRQGLRVWCAACSTGQEPYSFAMLWLDHFASYRLELVATDLSEPVLARARRGHYNPAEMARGLTAEERSQYFVEGAIAEKCRSMVEFRSANLIESSLRLGPFDLILCRNVLIYFDAATRSQVVSTLRRHLPPTGRLLIGASEVLDKALPFRAENGLYLPA